MTGPVIHDRDLLIPHKGIDQRFLTRLRQQLTAAGLNLGDPVYIRVLREERAMQIWMQPNGQGPYQLFTTLNIQKDSGGFAQATMGLGPKQAEGDLRAPEGFYQVAGLNPGSQYHLSLALNFPNRFDQEHDRTGSDVMIHGTGRSIGCFAIGDVGDARILRHLAANADMLPENNTQMNLLYTLVSAADRRGLTTPVHVFPFAMTEENMARHGRSRHASFWRQMMPAYRHFENTHIVPHVEVVGAGRDATYLFVPAPVVAERPKPPVIQAQSP